MNIVGISNITMETTPPVPGNKRVKFTTNLAQASKIILTNLHGRFTEKRSIYTILGRIYCGSGDGIPGSDQGFP